MVCLNGLLCSTGVVLVVLVWVFVVPGAFFVLSSRSSLPLRLSTLKSPPGVQKPEPGLPGPPPYYKADHYEPPDVLRFQSLTCLVDVLTTVPRL